MAEPPQLPSSGPDQILPAASHKTWEAFGPVTLQMTSSGPASEKPFSVYTMLKRTAEAYPNQRAMAVKRGGKWRYWTYEEYFRQSCVAAKAFIKLGLERYHSVCIMGFNSPEWLIANFGAIFAGGLSAGVYTTNSPEACRHLAEDSRAQIIVLEDEECLKKFLAVKETLPLIKKIVQWSGSPSGGALSWKELMDIGEAESEEQLHNRLRLQAVNQACSLIYTSGTTGPPKGVMCSQDSLTWVGNQHNKYMQQRPCQEHVVSFLPLSHLAAQMGDIYMMAQSGGTVHFAQPDALKGSILETLKEVQPTGFVTVPRLWEKIYEKMQALAKETGGAKKMIGTWAKTCGLNYYQALKEGREPGLTERLNLSMAQYLVLGRIKTALGLGRATKLVSGTAPISADILEYFMSLDLPIIEGYGLTESLSVGSLCDIVPSGFKHGSVGKVVNYTSIKLVDSPMASGEKPGEGEIAIKGRNIFMGYLNLPGKTDEAILDDGWMLTGDLGWFDEDKFLFITGRVKELVITAGGENIPPVLIENHIKRELPVLSNAMLVGDKRKYLTILLTVKCEVDEEGRPLEALDPEVKKWCAELGSSATTVTELREQIDADRQGALGKAVQKAIETYNNKYSISNAQKVQRWTILPHDFSLATGELNNTLKLKRSVTAKMYADTIEKLYSDEYPGLNKSKL